MLKSVNYFDVLDLADGECGEAAVSVVVGKKEAEARADEEAAAAATAAAQPPVEAKQQHVREGHRREDNGRGQVSGGRGQGYGGGRIGGYQGGRGRSYRYNYNNGNGGDEQAVANGQWQRGGVGQRYGGVYYNGGRQMYIREQYRRRNMQYMPEETVASDAAAANVENKTEEKVESADQTEENVAAAGNGNINGDGVAAGAESEKSAGESNSYQPVARDGSKKDETEKKPKKKRINGSQKRKMNKKKLDTKGADSKKRTLTPTEDDVKDMTLAEYEKVLAEKKKSLEASKSEERKVCAEEFEGLQVLEQRKQDDNAGRQKRENDKRKGKVGAVKEVKACKAISIHELLKPADGEEYVPPRPANYRPRRAFFQEDGSSNHAGGYRGGANGRGNGGFRGRNNDRFNGPHRENPGDGRVSKGEPGNSINGAPRGGYSGRGNGGFRGRNYDRVNGPQRDKSGDGRVSQAEPGNCTNGVSRGGGYAGRGNGAPRGGNNGGRGNAGFRGGY